MKNQILKLLRQIFVKEKKQLPMGVEAAGLDIKAEKIAKQLSDAGYQGPINLDFIKRINQSLTPTFEKVVPKASGEVFDLTGKKIHPGETIMGGKGIGMIADDYADLKEEYFRRIMTSTDEALNTFLKRGINASDERFASFSKNQRKDFLDMVDYRLKHGNEKFMNDFTDDKGIFNKFPEEKAYGGIAGMLGEPTYEDGGRVPLGKGKLVLEGLMKLANKIAPGSTKIGQTSKTMAPKTELKQAIAGFQKREAAAKLKEMIKKKYEGRIDDKLLNQILVDDNPQRIAEVLATIDEGLIMQGKGMGPDEIINAFKESWKRKKQASGGLAGMLGE